MGRTAMTGGVFLRKKILLKKERPILYIGTCGNNYVQED